MKDRLKRLLDRGLLTEDGLREAEAEVSGTRVEETLIKKGIPRHEILFSLAEAYGLPFIEYDEDVIISSEITRGLDMERLKRALWCPLSVTGDRARVIAYLPDSPGIVEDIKITLRVREVDFVLALPSDIRSIIENNQDLNPWFPPPAGRTPLAKVRTFLANRRSTLACYRTYLSRGRTGLAFLRTGLSFVTISVSLFRVFGPGWATPAEALLLVMGIVIAVDGLRWYIPARRAGNKRLDCLFSRPSWGTTVLAVDKPGYDPGFSRTEAVEDSETLRHDWKNLSPVMRRRFLASDRTDMAEERTVLACYRTVMAKARTGLAFSRTGFAFIGLGVTFIRYFKAGPWMAFDILLIAVGIVMAAEGFYWYLPGRKAGVLGHIQARQSDDNATIWDVFFPPSHKKPDPEDFRFTDLPLKAGQTPGIWATTGHALERTVLADRRNVMARLRTVMARSRTGLAFIRTGAGIGSIGLGLLVYFGASSLSWASLYLFMTISGIMLVADGLYWHLPAEKIRSQFPYCYGEMEIYMPDYGRPNCEWRKAVFDDEGY